MPRFFEVRSYLHLDLAKGAKWFQKGVNSPSLRVLGFNWHPLEGAGMNVFCFFKWHVGTQYTIFMNPTVGGRNPAITSWSNGSWNPLLYRGIKNIPGG